MPHPTNTVPAAAAGEGDEHVPPAAAGTSAGRSKRKRAAVNYEQMSGMADPPTDDEDVLEPSEAAAAAAAAPKKKKRRARPAKDAANAMTEEEKRAHKNEERRVRRQAESRSRKERKFQERLEELRAFKEEMGHCNVTREGNGTGRAAYKSLGHWVKTIREEYKQIGAGDDGPSDIDTASAATGKRKGSQLNDENIAALNAMGFEWDWTYAKAHADNWEVNLEKLKAYKSQYGTTNVAHCTKGENAEMYSLGGWVRSQKYTNRDGRLAEDRKAKLEAIGFDFTVRGHKDHNNAKWDAKFAKLKEFYDANGHSKVPNSHPEHELVKFYKTIRLTYSQMKAGTDPKGTPLTDEQIERLRSEVNFDFTIRSDRKRKTWEERYKQLGEFFVENGHCRVPCRYSKVLLLPRWVKEQRAEFRKVFDPEEKSKMTLEQYKKLEELGFLFVSDGAETERCQAPWSFCTCDFDPANYASASRRSLGVGKKKGGGGRKRESRPWEDIPAANDSAAAAAAAAAASSNEKENTNEEEDDDASAGEVEGEAECAI